ncbi:MAG: ATP-binding protein [Synergistaceae bacterium]|nr:ATP-binding protein [Synergistaceae bacterium]
MKVITEAFLRDELRMETPEVYIVPDGKILSPAAREYLMQRKIKIKLPKQLRYNPEPSKPEPNEVQQVGKLLEEEAKPVDSSHKYVDNETNAFYDEKPEDMTALYGNSLVFKDNPRIEFRGKLDTLQSMVVLYQSFIAEDVAHEKLLEHLGSIVHALGEMMRCDVLNEPYNMPDVLGLTQHELHDRSHNPMKYFKVKQMVLPHYKYGKAYAMLNRLRTATRETEVIATRAFRVKNISGRTDIIKGLNRLSSAFHVMMCMLLAGEYDKK